MIKTLCDNKIDSLKLRIIDEIDAKTNAEGLSQKQIAALLDTTQPRVSNLFNYQIGKFSLDKLFQYMYLLDIKVEIHIGE